MNTNETLRMRKKIGEDDDRVRIWPPLKPPLDAVCALFSFGGGLPHAVPGTGFLIAPDRVLTAAHNLYNLPAFGGFLQKGEVFFESTGEVRSFHSDAAFVPEEWHVTRLESYDFGVITLTEPIKSVMPIPMLTAKAHQIQDGIVRIAGFDPRFDGALMHDSGPIEKELPFQWFYSVDTDRGQSGAPILAQVEEGLFTIGIHTDGWKLSAPAHSPLRRFNYGVRLTNDRIRLFGRI